MSNSTIYEEFRKKIGKNSIRNERYVRTQCKNCGEIIEFKKSHQKTHKGYCVKCKATERSLKLTCQKFGHLTVVRRVENNKSAQSQWLCKCSCGNEIICVGAMLLRNHYKSCGCRHGLTLQQYIKSKVKVTKDGKWLWQGCFFRGKYGQAMWKGEHWRAHRLSYTAFVGEIPEGMCVCHKNDCPQDVNPENLFLSDNDGNMRDMVEKGRASRGSKNFNAKFTDEEVKQIRIRCQKGETKLKVSEDFNVHRSTIERICNGETWKHVSIDPHEI